MPLRVFDSHMHLLDNSLIAEGHQVQGPVSRHRLRDRQGVAQPGAAGTGDALSDAGETRNRHGRIRPQHVHAPGDAVRSPLTPEPSDDAQRHSGGDRTRRQRAGLHRPEGVPLLLRHGRHEGLPHPRVPAPRADGGRQRAGAVGDDAPVPRRGRGRGEPTRPRGVHDQALSGDPVDTRPLRAVVRLLADGAGDRPSQGRCRTSGTTPPP